MFQSRLVFLPDDAVSEGLALVRDNGYLVLFGPGGPVHRCAEDGAPRSGIAERVGHGVGARFRGFPQVPVQRSASLPSTRACRSTRG